MRVILETSIIGRDFQTSGSPFRVLFDGLARAGHSLHIPKLVIDEATNKYAEKLHDCQRRMGGQLREAGRITGMEIPSPLTDTIIEGLVEEYRQKLPSRLEQAGATIMPYPSTPHVELVARALDRRKPFSQSDAGYRDALIWENVIGLASSRGQDVAFISANKKDFWDDEGNLHPHLVADMEARGLQADRVTLFGSLEEFVDKHIKPTMEALEDIRQQLAYARYPGLDLAEEIAVRLPDIVGHREWEPDELGFPSEFETSTVSSVQDVQNIHVLDVRELYSGEFLIRAEADADCEFDVFIFKADYYAMSDQEAPYICDTDWNRHYFRASASTWVHIEVEMTFDPNVERVTSMQLLYMGKEPERPSDETAEQLTVFRD